MSKHKLIELQKVIDEFLQWIMRVIQPILNRDTYDHQQLGVTKNRLQMMQIIEFENILQERIQELKLKLKDSDDLRESDILINEIDTIESTLGRLMDLKYGDKARAMEIAEANHDFKQANRIRKQLVKIHDTEDEISAQCSHTKLRWIS
jgi:hypothetical protein